MLLFFLSLSPFLFLILFWNFQTESLVHDTSKNILLLAADKRSAAYNEGRIDAEIKAAKENVENLSFLKSAIIERR